jgi:Cof subfamily protein (haloacid dehalogenase superfamily)
MNASSLVNDKYEIIAIDLDGTALNGNHEFSSKTIDTLKYFSNKGVQVIIATGRSMPSVVKMIGILNLNQANFYFVCLNGSFSFNIIKETSNMINIFRNPIDKINANLLIDLAKRENLVLQYYNGDTGDVQACPQNDDHRELLQRYADLTNKQQIILNNYDEAITKSLSAKIVIFTNEPDLLIDIALKEFPINTFEIIRGSPHPFFVEFLPYGINKGEGLKKLCNHLNVSMDKVVSFGDGDNDKEMLNSSGLGIAMKNARPFVKTFAKKVSEWTNIEDSVAKELLLLEENNML